MAALRFFAPALAVVAALVVFEARPGRATVVVIPTLEEMTHRSDVVVHAVVRDVVVEEDSPGRLVTRTALEVLDGIAGAKSGDVLTVFQVGGQKDGRVAWVAGAHHFVVGEELVVFAVRPEGLGGQIVPYGIGFSLFSVVDGIDGKHIEEIAGDVVQLKKDSDGSEKMAAVEPRRFASLDGFKSLLRSILSATNPTLTKKKILRGPRAPSSLNVPSTSAKD
jgi:hypothetical protein